MFDVFGGDAGADTTPRLFGHCFEQQQHGPGQGCYAFLTVDGHAKINSDG